jgi:hypothetical protein
VEGFHAEKIIIMEDNMKWEHLENQDDPSYMEHLKANLKVAFKCFVLSLFHLAHGIVPMEITSHKYWNYYLFEKPSANSASPRETAKEER